MTINPWLAMWFVHQTLLLLNFGGLRCFFFFGTSSSLFELVRCSRRGKYCHFFFAGGLVGVVKHLVEVVSLV